MQPTLFNRKGITRQGSRRFKVEARGYYKIIGNGMGRGESVPRRVILSKGPD